LLEPLTHLLEPQAHLLEPQAHSLEPKAQSLEPLAHQVFKKSQSFELFMKRPRVGPSRSVQRRRWSDRCKTPAA
jgi:hypothetical protein